MRVLIVLTSAGLQPDGASKTGYSLPAFAAAYYALLDAGVEIALASPEGGAPPHDPADDRVCAAVTRLRTDREGRTALSDTLKLNQIVPDDFDAAIYPGGAGTLLDLSTDPHSQAILAALAREGKPVGVVGEGAAALYGAQLIAAADAPGAADVASRVVAVISARLSRSTLDADFRTT